jgi:quinol monooxygenase YgiN
VNPHGEEVAMTRSLLFLRARPDSGTVLLRTLERLGVLTAASAQPGFLGIEVATAFDDPDDIVLVESWASRELYERWAAGPGAALWHDTIRTLLVDEPVTRVYHVVEAVR